MALLDFSSYFPVLYIALGSVIVLFSRTLVQSWRFSSKNPPYPPGPPTRGLLEGNLKDIPTSQPWLTYTQWGKEYGELVHFRIYGQHTIVLNSFEAVKSLLEQRSNIYSDRPHIEMIYLTGWVYNIAFKRYGAEWRAHRRLFQQSFRPEASLAYRPIIARKVHDMLYNLLLTPEDFQNHYKTVAAAMIMGVVYGYDIEPKEDYFVSLAEAAVSKLSVCFFPGANAVNAIPILRYLPEWFPGAAFHHFAKEAKDLNNQMIDVPFEFVKKTMSFTCLKHHPSYQAAGTAPPSVASDLLSKFPSEDAEKNIKQVCATAYAGDKLHAPNDTDIHCHGLKVEQTRYDFTTYDKGHFVSNDFMMQTSSLMGTFFSLMALHPEIQKKAQREIDHVVGFSRLVDFDDRESLPYLDALCREIVRWRPVLPLCVTHGTSDEDTYKGYYIPKGKRTSLSCSLPLTISANVIPNVWYKTILLFALIQT
ncbi:LOW QUALITY PROTEIN: hypothetical protein CVT25_009336 [Psilocybe cyanescens]|uniref:Cytochrome P450 n=1 Tax=Psilocybe cyanescens TaxID=93625 RepID=A0A409VN95_PSICY|nr:LOW QUALITY PROTEIN: hypothetical protein CVT25_009336 [Psilocybe cyanescens]